MYQKPEEIIVIQFSRKDNFTKMEVVTMKNELDAFNEFVGGYIEVTSAVPDGKKPGEKLHLVSNEEGKVISLEPTIGFAKGQELVDYIAGNAVLLRSNEESDFDSLTDADIDYLMSRYQTEGVVTMGEKSYHIHIFNG